MLLCKNTSIQCAKSTQFLGVIIDDKLRWNDHILYVNNKISKYLGILYKIRRSLDNTTLTNMYYSLIFPYLIYGVEIWGRFLKLYLDSQVKFRRNASKVQNYFFFRIFSSLRATMSEIKYSKLRKTRNSKIKFNDV